MCTTDKSYEGEGVQLFYNKVFHRVHSENVPQVPNVINLIQYKVNDIYLSNLKKLYMLGGFAESSSLPVALDARGCSSTGGQVGLLL